MESVNMEKKCSDEQENNVLERRMPVANGNLSSLPIDNLYHIGFSTKDDLKSLFGNVKLLICGGSSSRMKTMAGMLARETGGSENIDSVLDLCSSDRYSMLKVGQVLFVSHGMGQPSISIMLHEVTKMLHYADATGVSYVRVGTSGGLGLEPGTLVVTKKAVDTRLKASMAAWVCGELVERETGIDQTLSEAIANCWDDPTVPFVRGNTMTTDDFYEGQGRMDGAICSYDEAKRAAFLERAYDSGVRNIEMECVVFAAFCHYLGIPCAVACVTLLNRMKGDQVGLDPTVMVACHERLHRLVGRIAKGLVGHASSPGPAVDSSHC